MISKTVDTNGKFLKRYLIDGKFVIVTGNKPQHTPRSLRKAILMVKGGN